ncbi:MAG: hypothetical protein PUC93_07230 [Oscillospiraceae bacterium]|nr:hypothetical protein [Oscillospiraceae bacterium]
MKPLQIWTRTDFLNTECDISCEYYDLKSDHAVFRRFEERNNRSLRRRGVRMLYRTARAREDVDQNERAGAQVILTALSRNKLYPVTKRRFGRPEEKKRHSKERK